MLNQPFGFVSSAEGFVFMSALLVSRVYLRDARQSEGGLCGKLWRRTLKIYGYHLLMLAFRVYGGCGVCSEDASAGVV